MFHENEYYQQPIQNVLSDAAKLTFGDKMVEAHGWCAGEGVGSKACQRIIWKYCIDALAHGDVKAVVDTTPALNTAWLSAGCHAGLAIKPDLNVLGYDFFFYLAHPLNSKAYAAINDAVITAAQDGLLSGLSTTWLSNTCTPSAAASAQITFHEMRGLFYIVAFVAGIVVLMIVIKKVLMRTGNWQTMRQLPIFKAQTNPDEETEGGTNLTELQEIRKLIALLQEREVVQKSLDGSEEGETSVELNSFGQPSAMSEKPVVSQNPLSDPNTTKYNIENGRLSRLAPVNSPKKSPIGSAVSF